MDDAFRAALADDLRADLGLDEGDRHVLYVDSTRNVTIGTGRNLTAIGISADEDALMLANDIKRAEDSLDGDYSWWRDLPHGPARVMANLMFNMGPARLAKFPRFLNAMYSGKWDNACAELQNSNWWTQVGERGPRMVARLMEGA